MNSSVDSQIAGLKNSIIGPQATEVVKDAENVTQTLNGKPLSGNNGIFEDDGVTAKNAANAKNVSTSINNKLISDIFEDDGVTVKNATMSEKAEKSIKKSDDSGYVGLIQNVTNGVISTTDGYKIEIKKEISFTVDTGNNKIILGEALKDGDIIEAAVIYSIGSGDSHASFTFRGTFAFTQVNSVETAYISFSPITDAFHSEAGSWSLFDLSLAPDPLNKTTAFLVKLNQCTINFPTSTVDNLTGRILKVGGVSSIKKIYKIIT